MSLSDAFEKLKGRIDRVRLGPKEDFDFRFLRPIEGDYVNVAGEVFSAEDTFAAGYEPFDEPVCSSVVPYGSDGILELGGAVSGEVGSMVVAPNEALAAALNGTFETIIDFHAPDGNTYQVLLQSTRLVNGGTPVLNRTTNSITSSGNNDYRHKLIAMPDVLGEIPELRWAIRPNSMNGGGENFQIQAGIDTYPSNYINGGQSNASQADWDNQTGIFANGESFVWSNVNNASNTGAFEFVGSEVSFRSNAQLGVGQAVLIELLAGPSFNICVCDRVRELEEQVNILMTTPPPSGTTTLFAGTVSGDMNAVDEVAVITQAVPPGAGWSLAANEIAFAGTPGSVDVNLNIYVDGIVGQRVTPRVLLQRKNGAGGTYATIAIADKYIRDASGAEEGNISLAYTDPAPGTDPIYRLLTQQGSSLANVVNATDDETSISLRAWV